MQNQKSKLKIEIQKRNSKMGIVLINSKTKINFPNGLRFGSAFLFCEAIIAQPFGFVNRCRKFFHSHIYTTSYIFMHICRCRNSHIYIYTATTTYIYTQLGKFACICWRICELMGWCACFAHVSIQLLTSTNPHIHRILFMGLFMC